MKYVISEVPYDWLYQSFVHHSFAPFIYIIDI